MRSRRIDRATGEAIAAVDRERLEVAVFAAVVAAALTLSACSKAAPPPPPPPDVVVADEIQKDVPIYAEWVGTTEGNVTAQIRARVQGYLQRRGYDEGTLVRAGDLLFVIDPRPYQAALDQAKGDLGRAQAAQRAGSEEPWSSTLNRET